MTPRLFGSTIHKNRYTYGISVSFDGTREEGKAPRHFSGSTSTNRSRISPLHMGRKALPSEERESGINKMIQRRQSGILN